MVRSSELVSCLGGKCFAYQALVHGLAEHEKADQRQIDQVEQHA